MASKSITCFNTLVSWSTFVNSYLNSIWLFVDWTLCNGHWYVFEIVVCKISAILLKKPQWVSAPTSSTPGPDNRYEAREAPLVEVSEDCDEEFEFLHPDEPTPEEQAELADESPRLTPKVTQKKKHYITPSTRKERKRKVTPVWKPTNAYRGRWALKRIEAEWHKYASSVN